MELAVNYKASEVNWDKDIAYFKANNVTYTEYDVGSNLEKRKEMVDKSGQLGVPVIIIDGDLTIGFDKPKIAKALGLA